METRHPIEGSFGSQFSSSVSTVDLWWPEVERLGKKCPFFNFWGRKKTTPDSPPHRSTLCADFVKLGQGEIGKVVHYLPDKKTKCRLTLPLSLLHGSRPKSAWASPGNDMMYSPELQISSKSAHFQRSYIRIHQHHPSVLQ